jgi:tripartite-type tricarboxylate transporter receptor subunit TctC
MKFKSLAHLLGGLYLASNAAIAAAAYPDKPLKLIVPYAVGGTTDIIARIVGVKLGSILGQTVVIENKPGAGGSVGSAYAAKQPADGYTLVMAVESSHAVNTNVYEKSPYDPVKDFAPISNLADVPNVLVINPDLPAKNIEQFIKLLKTSPDKFAFGSSGNGGLSHMNGELFMSVTGTKMLHVPYKGLGPALNDLVAGQLQVVFDNLPSSFALIQGQRIRPLVVTAKERLKSLPDVPTYAEVGLPALNNPSWFGLAAPANTPTTILDTLNKAVLQALKDPETIAAIEKQGAIPSPMTRKEFGDLIQRSNEQWGKVVKDIGFTKLN